MWMSQSRSMTAAYTPSDARLTPVTTCVLRPCAEAAPAMSASAAAPAAIL